MADIYLVDAAFLVTRPVRSLPEFHGARWSAWLRHACRNYGAPLDSLIKGILPLRSGKKPLESGEVVFLRLIASDPVRLGGLGGALCNTAAHGEFSPSSLQLLFWQEAPGGRKHPPDAAPAGMKPLSLAHVEEEVALLASLDTFSLVFHTPLRLRLPAGMKTHETEVKSYCQPEFFSSGQAIDHLAARVRFWQFDDMGVKPQAVSDLSISARNLVWRDLRYSQTRQIALGGITGEIRCQGRIDRSLATRLVLGQYLGAGKNPLFGLGYWTIPELAEVKKSL